MPSRETGLQAIRARANPAALFFILFAVAVLALTLVLVLEKEESRDAGMSGRLPSLYETITLTGRFILEDGTPAAGAYDVSAALQKDGIAIKLDIQRIILHDGETTEVKLDLRN